PQKTQVRCYQQDTLFRWLAATIRKSLGQRPAIGELPLAGLNATSSESFTAPPLEPGPQVPLTRHPDPVPERPTYSSSASATSYFKSPNATHTVPTPSSANRVSAPTPSRPTQLTLSSPRPEPKE